MSNSTVRLYDLLKADYPGKTYVGQIPQSVNLQTADGVILLESVSSEPTKNKDNAKRDQIVYYIHVIGSVLKTVDTLTEEIRNLVEPYTDEYIYHIEFDNTATDFNPEAETWERVLVFNVWPNTDGLNQPSGTFNYYEHYVRFYNDSSHEILNSTDDNYLPITWSYSNFAFHATHNVTPITDVDVFRKLVNYSELSDRVVYYLDQFELTIINEETGHTMDDVFMLIRIPKNATGSFSI